MAEKHNKEKRILVKLTECPRQAKGNGRIPKNPDVPKKDVSPKKKKTKPSL